jgi:hypothetical protein
MNRAEQISEQIRQLERKLADLKKEWAVIQANCQHEDIATPLTRVCRKCLRAESLYY